MKFTQDCGCDRDRAGRRRRSPALCSAAAALPLLLLLLLPRAAAVPLPAADSSGEAELEEAAVRRAALPDCVRLARLLHARAAQLQEEVGTGRPAGSDTRTQPAASGQGAIKPLGVSSQMCEKFTVCGNSMEMLVQNNLNLPKMTEEDGCLFAGFDEARTCSPFCSNAMYMGQFCLLKKTAKVDLKICAETSTNCITSTPYLCWMHNIALEAFLSCK